MNLKNKHYKIFSTTLLVISILLFVAFILTSVFIYINQPSLYWQLDSSGFKNFLNIFSPSLQIGTATIVVFTLWLTLMRMQQTQDQLVITYENVNFNNYFKHKDLFTQLLIGLPFFKFIIKNSNINPEPLIPAIYSYFFNSTYKNFEPKLNNKARIEVDNFIKQITDSALSNENQDLDDVDINEIRMLSILINRTIEPLCKINFEIEVLTVRQYLLSSGFVPNSFGDIEERFKLLNNLYWTISLYETFLEFEGTIQSKRANFSLNFIVYRSDIGLE